MSDTVYLTGSSGFIGQMIVQQCEKDSNIGKVYCPIREKQGETGQERFDQLFAGSPKACFVHDKAPIPQDTTLLVLNAYSVKFARPIVEILNDNVKPMLDLLDQCQEPGRRVRGISVVSTAYVQPPLPFRRDADNRMAFLLRHKHTSAHGLYQDLVQGSVTPEQVMSSIDSHLQDFYTNNCYAFSKHMMEHIIHERYPELPVCIVRPSIVAPSRDGRHGHGVRSGFSLFLDLARLPIFRFPRNEGKLSLVYVEDVASDIIQGARQLAQAAAKSDDGTLYHPILSSTTASETDALASFYKAAPSVWRFYASHDGLRTALRAVELFAIRCLSGKKAARIVEKVYQNFDPIMQDQWDFVATHPTEDVKLMMDKYYAVKEKSERTKTSSTAGSLWDGGNTLFVAFLALSFVWELKLSPALQMARLFIVLRMGVLMSQQALFYGDTVVRNLMTTTVNGRSHDSKQHGREEIIWPSVLVSGIELYVLFVLGLLPDPMTMRFTSWKSVYLVLATHALPVEFVYYWGHRWMHSVPELYKVHKHHHLSIVPSPKTSVTFLWSEHVFYDLLFALPILVPVLFGEATIVSTLFYVPAMDFVNTLGHTNLEVFPKWYIHSPFYYFFYCTTYHHVHHKYFKYNYALFMPIYDIIFGTYSKELTETDFMAAHKCIPKD